MVQGDQKFKRFLNSIGIIDVESFDMRFLSIIKDPNKDNFFIYDIEKDTPWSFKLVNQFINSLNNIVSYDYKLIFEYKHEELGMVSDRWIGICRWGFSFCDGGVVAIDDDGVVAIDDHGA